MKTMIFPVAGLLVGLLGGTVYGGLKEKNVILAEKAAQEAQADEEYGAAEDSHAEDTPAGHEEDQGSSHAGDQPPGGGDEESVLAEDHTDVPDDAVSREDEISPMGELPSREVPGDPTGTTPGEAEATFAGDSAGAALQPDTTTAIASPQESEGTGFLSEESGGPERMAKIFGAMKAPDAAKVLQNLDDLEVRAILSFLSNRKAAEILGNFEPERAAALSRLVLGSSGGGAR
jgi:hypothetical protein